MVPSKPLKIHFEPIDSMGSTWYYLDVETKNDQQPDPGDPTMASTASLQVKMILTLIEAIDTDDKADAEAAIKLIKALIESGEKAAK
jgi:hypothetical protein